MKKSRIVLTGSVGLFLLVSGCKTTEVEAPEPFSWEQQSAYTSRVKDPRMYRIDIYNTPAGVQYRGGSRLHPGQGESLPMMAEVPVRPVVPVRVRMGRDLPFLLDFTSAKSYLTFNAASLLHAVPIGEREAQLSRLPGDEVIDCLSVVPSIRLNQLFIENVLFQVRLAEGSLGAPARGVIDPSPEGILGWDVLSKFEQICLGYSEGQVLMVTDKPCNPSPDMKASALQLEKHAGACAVRGMLGGKACLVLIDPVGDFELAGAALLGTDQVLQLGTFDLSGITPVPVPEQGIRLGARFLQNYNVTICPRTGAVYFERRAAE